MMTDINVALVDTERALCAVLLSEPRTLIPVWGRVQPTDLCDLLCARIYSACLTLAQARQIPNVYTVAQQLPDVPIDALLAIQERVNVALVEQVLALADVIREAATQRRVIAKTQALAQQALQQTPAEMVAFVQRAIGELAQTSTGAVDRPADVGTILAEVDVELASDNPIPGIATGFPWLTERIGGWRPGWIVAVIAPYKARKSTVMRHIALAAAQQQKQTALYVLEGTRDEVVKDLWVMLATKWLHKRLSEAEFQREATLDSLHLHRSLRTEWQHQALTAAHDELAKLRDYLRICDGRDAVKDLTSFRARVQRDRFLYHTDMAILDHLQLMDGGSPELFKNVERTVGFMQSFAVTEGVIAQVLSQQNEASIDLPDDTYSPGTKGGGALAAAADVILMTKYDSEKEPDLLTLRLKHARRATPGKKQYVINPSSGWILGEWNGS